MEDKNNQNPQPDNNPPTPGNSPVGGQTFQPGGSTPSDGPTPPQSNGPIASGPPPSQANAPESPSGPGPMPPQQSMPQMQSGEIPQSPKKGKKLAIISGAVVGVLLLAGGAYAAYAQIVMPERVLTQYAQRLADFESGSFEVGVSGEAEEDSTPISFDITSSGSFTGSDLEDIRFDTASDISIGADEGGLAVSFDLNLDARYVDETAYLRTNNVDLVAAFLPGLEANTWYSFDADLEEEDTSDLTCSTADQDAITDYFENDASEKIEIEDATRHTWLPMERNGERVQHYSGSIAGTVLQTMASDLASVTSDDCISQEDIDETEQLNDVTFDYQLYTGSDYDELVVAVTEDGENLADVTLITSDYNQPVEIEAPSDAVDFEEMLDNQFGSFGTGDDFGTFDESEIDENWEEDWDFEFPEDDGFTDTEPELR